MSLKGDQKKERMAERILIIQYRIFRKKKQIGNKNEASIHAAHYYTLFFQIHGIFQYIKPVMKAINNK